MNIRRASLICAALCLCVGLSRAQRQTAGADNPNPELVGQLTNQLGITPQQATGATGTIFSLAKSRLAPAQFSKLAAAVPGMNGFLKAAPAAAPNAAGTTDPLSALGGAGNSQLGSATSAVQLATSFKSLGLSPAMATKMMPILQNYVGARGGSSTAGLLTGLLK